MRVCFFGCYNPDEERNVGLVKGLKRNGVEVLMCNDLSNPYFLRYPRLLAKNVKLDYDIVFVPWYSQGVVPFARLLTRKPIVIDAYLGLYETSVIDRKVVNINSFKARLFYYLDKYHFRFGDLIISDTNEHIKYFHKEFGVKTDKFRRIFNTTDDDFWRPCEKTFDEKDEFQVKFCGGFIPLQGIEYIIKAAKLLETQKGINFELIGRGQTYNDMYELANQLKVKNVRFTPIWTHYSKVPSLLANASVLLGIFGKGEKSRRVIPSKVIDALAMKKPVITGDSPAAREILQDRENCILVPMANPEALAEAILTLKDDKKLRDKIAENGYKLFKEKLSPKAIGKELKSILMELIEK